MIGWPVPPPKKPQKSKEQFLRERKAKVTKLIADRLLESERIVEAMSKVPREEFIPEMYRDYAYLEVPLPLPGENATISCPHSYPLFYESLQLAEGEDFLEVGTGSGYGAALAAEIVGESGKVVTVEIDRETYEFGTKNLRKLGYVNVLTVLGDGSLGFPSEAPYDKICVTASCRSIPDPLVNQLRAEGRLATPVGGPDAPQDLVLLEKRSDGTLTRKLVEQVLYVPLKGEYGWSIDR